MIRGNLTAVTMMPPALYQDNYWGSDAGRDVAFLSRPSASCSLLLLQSAVLLG